MTTPHVIGYQIRRIGSEVFIEESRDRSAQEQIKSSNIEKLLWFLLEEYDHSLKVVWNLEEDFAPIFRLMGEKACRDFASIKHATRLSKEHISIRYIPHKFIKITQGRYSAYIYELEQYFPDLLEKPLNARDVMGAGNTVVDAFASIGLECWTLSSPVAVFRETLRDLELPTVKNLPAKFHELAEYAYIASGSPIVEAHKMGWAEKAIDVDLKSAYPSMQMNIPDWRNYKRIWSSNRQEEADFGWCKGIVHINDGIKMSPIVFVDEFGNVRRPTGEFPAILPLVSLENIQKLKIGTMKIEKAWYIKLFKYQYPLRTTILDLFNKRLKADGMPNIVLKRISVGVTGLTAQIKDDGSEGEFFDPITRSYILAPVDVKISQFLYNNDILDNVLHISTDGILLLLNDHLKKSINIPTSVKLENG